MNEELGKLEKVELRTAWKHEALDFTQWLALEKNLSLLSEEIGIDIKLIETEARTGRFSTDILAEEENKGRRIIIENQLEVTDHDHLGKIITYASGHDAEIVIWIVKDVRDNHKRAIDWLNEHTDENLNFFVIKMELWKIGNSLPAPKFQIISKPNDWAKVVKKGASQPKLTDTKLMQLDFWNAFKEYASENSRNLRLRKTYPQHWYDISVGSSEAHISLTINTQSNEIGCELYIDNNNELFSKLKERRIAIENEIEGSLLWQGLEGRKASRIKVSIPIVSKLEDGNIIDKSDLQWLMDQAENFLKTFGKYIREINFESSRLE